MSAISGYQVVSIVPHSVELAGLACVVATIQVKGCSFTGIAAIDPDSQGKDPFHVAGQRAIQAAVAESKKSDFQLYNRPASGGGYAKGGGGRPQADPSAVASSGAIGGMFMLGKDKAVNQKQVRDLIAEAMGAPWSKELEVMLTNGQVDAIRAKIEAKKPAEVIPQAATFAQKNLLKQAAADAGVDLEAWLIEKYKLGLQHLTKERADAALIAMRGVK